MCDKRAHMIVVKNTFVDVVDREREQWRRSSSAPDLTSANTPYLRKEMPGTQHVIEGTPSTTSTSAQSAIDAKTSNSKDSQQVPEGEFDKMEDDPLTAVMDCRKAQHCRAVRPRPRKVKRKFCQKMADEFERLCFADLRSGMHHLRQLCRHSRYMAVVLNSKLEAMENGGAPRFFVEQAKLIIACEAEKWSGQIPEADAGPFYL